MSVLHLLSRTSPVRLSELTMAAQAAQVTQSAVTQLVTRLEQDGLVERQPDPSDRRGVLVGITPAGRAFARARHAERVRRYARTRWPLDAGNDDGYYGVRRYDIEKLVGYWGSGYGCASCASPAWGRDPSR